MLIFLPKLYGLDSTEDEDDGDKNDDDLNGNTDGLDSPPSLTRLS